MRIREEMPPISKVHNSVQSMLAEARRIIKPINNQSSNYVSNNSHFQIHLPSGRVSENLKEILHLSSQSYRKIDRKRRLSLIKIQDHQTIDKHNSSLSSKPIIINRLNDRQELKGVINNFESQLIDKKFHQFMRKNKLPLYNKKAKRLLPQIQDYFSPSKSKSTRQEDNNLLQKFYQNNQRYKQTDSAKIINQTKQYQTLQIPQQKKIEVLILSTLSVPSQNHSIKKLRKTKIPQLKISSKASIKRQINEEEKYTPWDLQPEQIDLGF